LGRRDKGLGTGALARQPGAARPGLRFFSPGQALAGLEELIHVVERDEVPASLNLGGEFTQKALLPVLRHLRVCWALQTAPATPSAPYGRRREWPCCRVLTTAIRSFLAQRRVCKRRRKAGSSKTSASEGCAPASTIHRPTGSRLARCSACKWKVAITGCWEWQALQQTGRWTRQPGCAVARAAGAEH
jgi:hypothetical protein